MSDIEGLSNSYDSDSSSSDISIPDIVKLKPYDFEPEASSSDEYGSEETVLDCMDTPTNFKDRIGNTDWCLCGKCRAMDTYSDSLCCRDTNEIPDDSFQGRVYINV